MDGMMGRMYGWMRSIHPRWYCEPTVFQVLAMAHAGGAGRGSPLLLCCFFFLVYYSSSSSSYVFLLPFLLHSSLFFLPPSLFFLLLVFRPWDGGVMIPAPGIRQGGLTHTAQLERPHEPSNQNKKTDSVTDSQNKLTTEPQESKNFRFRRGATPTTGHAAAPRSQNHKLKKTESRN